MEVRREFEDDDDLQQYLLDTGCIVVDSVDEDGEFLFTLNEEACKKYAPQLWEMHTQEIDEALVELVENGLVEVEYNENLEATFTLTEKGRELAEQLGFEEQ